MKKSNLNMERNGEWQEVAELREQINLLKQRVEREDLRTEQMIRRAVHEKMSRLNRRGICLIVLALCAIPYMIWTFDFLGLSHAFCSVTCIFFVVAALHTHLVHDELRASDISDEPLVGVAAKVLRLKRNYRRWLYFSIPFLCCWILWFLYEALHSIAFPMELQALLGGVACGLVIGLILGIRSYRRTQRTASEMLEQIASLEQE